MGWTMIDFLGKTYKVSEITISQHTCFVPETVNMLLSLAKERVSGTFTAPMAGEDNAQDTAQHMVFSILNGQVKDIAFPGRSTLEEALQAILPPAELKKARKTAAKQDITVGEAILDRNVLDDEQAVNQVLAFVGDTFNQVLTAPVEDIQFTPSDQSEACLSDLGGNYEIQVAMEELLLNALADKEDGWSYVMANFSVLQDVYYATPNAVTYFHDQHSYPDELAILQELDGQRDVEEAITSSGLPPFRGFQTIQQLAAEGIIELVNPVQLFQLGLDEEEQRHWAKALRLYQRALDRGLDDFDLQYRLAHAFEKTGDKNTAISKYLDFADKCAKEFRFEDTLRALKRITRLDQDNIPIRRRYIQLLIKYDKKTEATDESLKLAETLMENGRHDEAMRILSDAVAQCPDDSTLQEKYIKACEACNAQDELLKARQHLTRIYSEREDSSQALGYFQKLFVEGEDNAEVRLKLIELHLVQGNKDKALDHLEAVLAPGNPYNLSNLDDFRQLHLKRCQINPGNRFSAWFLIEDALSRKNLDDAEKYLRELIAHLDDEDDRNELICALSRLVNIFPDKIEYRWQLVQEFEKTGKREEANAALRQIANIEKDRGNATEALRALDEILRLTPYDRDAREERIGLLTEDKDKEGNLRERKHLAMLMMLAGETDRAQSLCREITSISPQDAYLFVMLAELCAETGDLKMAGEQYSRAGKLLLSEKNIGLAKVCADHLQTLGTHAKQVEELQKGINQALTADKAGGDGGNNGKRDGSKGDEPFSHMKKRVLKRSISNITARLKNMKTGKAGKSASVTETVSAGGQSDGGTGSSGNGAGKTGGGGKTVTSGVSSALSKLKSLSGGGKGSPGGTAAKPATANKPAAKPVKLNNAADKLKALKNGGGGKKAPAATAGDNGETSGDGPDTSGSESLSASDVPAEAKKSLKLGSAASKLAKLRKS